MHFSAFWRMAALLSLLAAAPFCAQAQQDASQQPTGDPVADAARKARAQQKEAPKPKKVFTNDDIPSAPATTPAQAATTDQSAAKQPASDKKAGAAESPEKEWRARFADVHGKIAKTQQELDVLQRELEKAQVQYYPDPQKAMTQQYDRSDINDKTAKIDAKKKELADLKQQESDMEDELRKAGGDPGWARQPM